MTHAAGLLLLTSGWLAACGSDVPPPPADAGVLPDAGPIDSGTLEDGGTPLDSGAAPSDAAYLTRLSTPSDLAALTSTLARGVKYLAPAPGRPPVPPLTEPCYFQNMRQFPWHVHFINSFPGLETVTFQTYVSWVLNPASRRFYGGAVEPWPNVLHPVTRSAGIITYTVYTDANSLAVEDLVFVDQLLKERIPFAATFLVFVPEAADQEAFVVRERQNLLSRGIIAMRPSELVQGTTQITYSEGEGYGTLRIVPKGFPLGDYGPRDVVIVESVPNDISIVSGLISANPQNALGHVNLRLREKRIPNVALPAIYDSTFAKSMDGLLVHLLVETNRFMLEPARLEDAQAYWAAHQPHVPQPEADLNVRVLAPFTSLRATGRTAYGVKAANLGEIRSVLAPPNANDGFAIPFSAYKAFVDANGISAQVGAFLADPARLANAAVKRAGLKALRDQIRAAPMSAELFGSIQSSITSVFGAEARDRRIRFRSSTNVEDLADLAGAGLYDSKSGCLADDLDSDLTGPSLCLTSSEAASMTSRLAARQAELTAHPERTYLAAIISDLQQDLTEEKPVELGVKKVWASLWTERAFDEREYYGIDHQRAFMGIAVNPSFVLEQANAVVVSNLHLDQGDPVYSVSSQLGEESVVRPDDPTAVAEFLTFRRHGEEVTDVRVDTWSSLLPPGTEVWPRAKLLELAGLLFRLHDHFAATVYPQISPLSLDFEVKLAADGAVVVKQARPFTSRAP